MYYDFDVVDCTNIHLREQDRVLDADEVLDCPEFVSALTSAAARGVGRIRARTYLLAAALTLAAAWGAIHLGRGPRQTLAPLPLHASVVAPEVAMKEEGLLVTATVVNTSERLAEGVEVRLTGKSMSCLTCQSVTPPEAWSEAGPRGVTALLGDIPPGEDRVVSWQFSPSRTGEISLVASVTAANSSGSTVKTLRSEIVP